MAKAIDLLVTKEALSEVEKLITLLRSSREEILALSSAALQGSKNISSIKTPGGLAQSIKENKDLTDALQTQVKMIDGVETGLAELTKVRKAATKATYEERVALQEANKQGLQNARAVSEQVGAYGRLSAQLLLAKRAAQDIGATYGSTSKQFLAASRNAQILEKELRDIDRALGDNRRNVGNYTGGYNALGTSISRLAQELPNAGQSFQIFALSLGNNFAAVKDAIDGIIQKNKELKASGQATESIFKQITSQVFSFNTAFFVAIALVIAFSKEIGELGKGLFSLSNSFDSVTQSKEAFDKAQVEGLKSTVEAEISLKRYLEIAKDASLSDDERTTALKKLRQEYPFYLKNLSDNQILSGETAEAEREIVKALRARGEAEKFNEQIIKNKQRLIELAKDEAKAEDEINEQRRIRDDFNRRSKNALGNEERSALRGLAISANRTLNRLIKERSNNKREIQQLDKENEQYENNILQLRKNSIGLEFQLEKIRKARAKAPANLDAIEVEPKGFDSLINRLKEAQKQAQLLQDQLDPTNNAEAYEALGKRIFTLGFIIDSYYKKINGDEGVKGLKKLTDRIKENQEATIALNAEVAEFIRNISYDYIKNSPLPSLAQFFDGTFDRLFNGAETLQEKFAVTFNAIGNVAKETFNFIAQINQASFDQQFERLEKQRDIAIKFAGQSVAAQEEIQEEYEKRRLAIARQQAKAQKETALFSAIINIAQGVTAALATGPAGIALAAIIGVLGAAQIALIASQPLPEYWKGRDGGEAEWALTQERGRELILDKNNRIKSFGSDRGATKTWLDDGDKVKTASETKSILSELAGFDLGLNRMLFKNNIGSDSIKPTIQVGASASEIGREMERVMKNRPNLNLNIDKDGFTTSLIKQGSKINYINNRVSGKADTV